jgi:tRNA(adenine34) deaminase
VGAVIVRGGKIIASAYNRREKKQNALYHAEILAIDKACKKLKTFRLNECDLYVTLEPCAMCAGAIINARISAVYFGAYDQKRGCAGSLYNLLQDKNFNHNPLVVGGIMEETCANILTNFFESKR